MYSEIGNTGIIARDQMRRKFVNIFKEGLSDKNKFNEEDRRWAAECALKLEDCLYSMFREGKPYADKARFLIFNLGNSTNQELKMKLLS